MASATDLSLVFLSGLDKKALRCVSRETAVDGRSLEVRLLAMTRRANAEQLERGMLQDRYNADLSNQEAMQLDHRRQNRHISHMAERTAATNRETARLIRRVRNLRIFLETGELPDDDWDAFFAIDDGQ